ncbi:MAG: electron transfer flavoprotein subunit alpha/FixB family protein [Deltaproteobacteria bacterium]|nr:electron transfer flavoprotein subunit alpha/FixB family protein [Deltaproteobacteria bacterium]
MSKVLAIVEAQGGTIRPVTLSALTLARQAAAALGGSVELLVIGKGVQQLAQAVSAYGDVLVADQPELEHYLAESWTHVVMAATRQQNVRLVVAAATTLGKDLLPRVSGALDAGMASDVSKLVEINPGAARFLREMWAGNVLGVVEIGGPVALVTARPTEFAPAAPQASPGTVKALPPVALGGLKTSFAGFTPSVSERPDLTEARVVASAGRGTRGVEGIKLIEQLADLFNGALGATRAVVDAGWLPNDLQVGQTGKVVAPELYFAVGMSGAIQHLAGMKGSKVIVAINKDEEAPIFSVADYGLVADLFKAVPELVALIKANR